MEMKRYRSLFLLAFLFRVSHLMISLRDPVYVTPIIDSATYVADAIGICKGEGFQDVPFWQGPLYPIFLAIPFLIAPGSIALAGFFQCIVGSLGCLLTYSLGKRLLSDPWAFAAAFVQALYPLAIFFDVEILPPVILLPLLVATAYLLLEWRSKGYSQGWQPVMAGGFMGLACLAVPSTLLSACALLFWFALCAQSSFQKAKAALLFALGIILCILPATLRNSMAGSERCLISSNGGINFYIGNNSQSLETQSIRPGIEWQILLRSPVALGYITPVQRSTYFYKEAFRWASENPKEAWTWSISKLFLSLHSREIMRNRDFYRTIQQTPWLRFPPRPFALLIGLALVGAWRVAEEKRHDVWLCVLMAGTVLGINVLFFPTARYRMGAVPFLCILAMFGSEKIWTLLCRSHWKEAIPWTGAFSIVFLVSLAPNPFPSNESLNRDLYNRAHVHLEKGKIEEAIPLFLQCIRQGVGTLDAWNGLAICRFRQGQSQEAEKLWHHLVLMEPKAFEAHYNLGISLQEKARYEEAMASYTKARALDPTMVPLLLRMAFCSRMMGQEEVARQLVQEAAAFNSPSYTRRP